jgi:hypothetical protein
MVEGTCKIKIEEHLFKLQEPGSVFIGYWICIVAKTGLA